MAKRRGRKKIVGAVPLSASVVGGAVTLPEKTVAQEAPVQLAQAHADGIPFLGQGNRSADDHPDHEHDY